MGGHSVKIYNYDTQQTKTLSTNTVTEIKNCFSCGYVMSKDTEVENAFLQ